MHLGVNVPNFGPGTDPGVLREWARTVEGLGYDLLMMSDHLVITPDVAERYPEPFYEPFTTLAWLAGATSRLRFGTTVLILPYRDPRLTARTATTLHRLTEGRLVLGVGIGWARQEFEALGVPYPDRGRLTDHALATLRRTWQTEGTAIPLWIGGNSAAGRRRTLAYGDAWHPLRPTLPWLRAAVAEQQLPGLAPRIALRLTTTPVTGPDRPAGVGTLDQVLTDLRELRELGADSVVLDPYHGDPAATLTPATAWRDLTAVATHWKAAP